MKNKSSLLLAMAFVLLLPMHAQAASVGVGFTKLTGALGGTGVFKADLSSLPLTELASIILRDTGGTEGSPGIWSGFDLDAIKLSTSDCADAACAGAAASTGSIDFASAVFTAGSMDPVPMGSSLEGPCLAGTSGGGCDFDNSIATLSSFDALFASAPGSGFLSLGRLGVLALNLNPALALGGPLFMYVGEAGNNGETLRGLVEVSDVPSAVPLPAAVWLFGSALVGFIGMSRRRRIG